MQSVQIAVLEKQIEQLFIELVSIWKDSDTQKIKSVKALAYRMEELYIQVGMPIDTISTEIKRRLEAVGIKTAHHVPDYLDSKYKQDKGPNPDPDYQLSEGYPHNGIIDGNNLLNLMNKINGNISQVTKDDAQLYHDSFLKMESTDKAVKELCDRNGWPLVDDDPLKKKYAKVTTDMPDPKETDAYYAFKEVLPIVNTFQKTHEEICKKLFLLPPEERRVPEMVQAIKEYAEMLRGMVEPINEFLAPLKDLKFATSKPRWWKTVIKYVEHGKHAAAVMEPILSHRYLEDRLINVLKIQCPHPNCEYFATVSEITVTPMDASARPQLKLLIDHIMDNHPKETRRLPIAVERAKIQVQVPSERDLTREEVGDKIKEHVLHAIKFVYAIKAFDVLSRWREATADGRVASRRIDAREKLSDLA